MARHPADCRRAPPGPAQEPQRLRQRSQCDATRRVDGLKPSIVMDLAHNPQPNAQLLNFNALNRSIAKKVYRGGGSYGV